MGVKDLWGILTPICERKPIWELQDKTIAIDLSAWICDSSTVAEHSSQRNMYLRNLFFRTSFLLLLGVKPIFVLEGKAPVLKHDTIERRQIAQGRSAGRNVKAGSRARLKGLQTQCATLLSSLGLKCIQGDGEAEAFCAHLNQAGLVDGVVTQDSDVFLYGGVKVYRHFNTSCAGGGSVDTYEMAEIVSRLGLGRNHLIALSLLCGCDYNKGVPGVGKESALRFFQSVPDEQILDRIQSWRQNTHMDSIDVKKDKSISPEFKCELQIRSKALQDQDFPCEELLSEFLQNDQRICPRVNFQWSKPNISQFLKLADLKLGWDSTYALEKVLPLLTRWHLAHNDSSLEPERIINAKTTRGIKGYVVKWLEFEATTEEPQSLFQERYPLLVEAYVETKKKGKKAKTKKNKENQEVAAKTKPIRSKVKTSQSNEQTDILQEINTQHNTNATKNEKNNDDHLSDLAKNKSNEDNKTKLRKEKKLKSETKKKETGKENAITEESLVKNKKSFKSHKSKDKGGVDIRNYFKTKLNEKLDLSDDKDMLDESMNALNTSINLLSISNPGQSNYLWDKRNNGESSIKDLDMSSIVIDDTNRRRRDTDRVNDLADSSMSFVAGQDKISSGTLERRKSEERKDRNREEKYKSMDLMDDDDVFNYSFNTACQMMIKDIVPAKTDGNTLDFDAQKKSVDIMKTKSLNLNHVDRSEMNMSLNTFKNGKKSVDENCLIIEPSILDDIGDIDTDALPSSSNNSAFYMSVNNSNIHNPADKMKTTYELMDESHIQVSNKTSTKFYETFQTQLKSSNTSVRIGIDSEENMSFIENEHDTEELKSCDNPKFRDHSSHKKSSIFTQTWNTSSPLLRCKPTHVSMHQVGELCTDEDGTKVRDMSTSRVKSSLSFGIDDFECDEIADLSDIIENIVSQR